MGRESRVRVLTLPQSAHERLAGEVAEQAAALLQARLRALPQAPRLIRRQVQRVQERPAALRRRPPAWGTRLASEPWHASGYPRASRDIIGFPLGQPCPGLSSWSSATLFAVRKKPLTLILLLDLSSSNYLSKLSDKNMS